ncbi:MAG: penicillin-binding protein 2, partial [Clostridium sp.]
YYNDSLIGINGREYGYLDEDANLEGVVKSAVNGKTLVSTIDLNVQNILQKYIDEWQNSVGSHVTAAIAMDPNNGEVLGMATSNKFDLNDPRQMDFLKKNLAWEKRGSRRLPQETDQTTEDQALDIIPERYLFGKQVPNQLWRNFCQRYL